ncbi:MAG: YchE family NAAT transporter [Buchnera aphidicola (Eriosoma harunire)]
MQFLIHDVVIYAKFFISLFALVNPIGMIPIFMSMTINNSNDERNKINLKSNIAASLILCITLFIGDLILHIFGISINSFRIAGGILIIIIAMSMITGKIIEESKHGTKIICKKNVCSDVSIVPLAMPLIAGPGAISSTIVWSNCYFHWINLFLCCIVIIFFSFCCWLLFRTGPVIVRMLGHTGVNILTRVMGLLLMSLGIEFITISVRALLYGII